MLEVEPTCQRGRPAIGSVRSGVAAVPFQKHSLGGRTCQAGAVWLRRLDQLRYPRTTAMWAANLQHVHGMPASDAKWPSEVPSSDVVAATDCCGFVLDSLQKYVIIVF